MVYSEEPRLLFVVRIWIEEETGDTASPIWRGSITNVLGEECRYLEDLQTIPTFITPYLRTIGVGQSLAEHLRSGLRRLLTRWKAR
jgi:hypothetical protein